MPVPFERTPPLVLWQGNQLTFDIGRAAAFWLTLESERYALRRDAHDRVPSDASLLAAGWWLDRPPVHAYARLLAEGLDERGKRWDRMPLWPNGKRYAVALTHDVDAPERRTRCRSAIAELLFGGPRPRRHAYWELREEIHARGFGDALLRPMSRRPEWNFSAICEMEQQYGFRSAFYFAVVSRSIGHPCDVDYDASRRRYRRLCRRLRDGGWEVGLHASYLTHQGVLPAEGQHRRLEALAEAGPAGVRHHYLHLGPGDPLPAMTAHAAAGALYDSTMGFNDAPGFRLGAALPVELYDPQRAASSGLIELPMSLADMHLPQRDASAAIGAAIEHLKTVRDLGGLGVLNWHVGVWHDCPAWKESYAAACEFLSEDAEAWIATPREIAAWWKERASRLNPLSATQPHLSAKVAAPPRC